MGEVFRYFSAPGQYVRLAVQPSGGVSVERIELCRITHIRHLDVPFLQLPSAVPPKGPICINTLNIAEPLQDSPTFSAPDPGCPSAPSQNTNEIPLVRERHPPAVMHAAKMSGNAVESRTIVGNGLVTQIAIHGEDQEP
jgi:hypothetical protein